MAIQRVYRKYQQPGWPGYIARPAEPTAYDLGQIYVPTGGPEPEPGMGVMFDRSRSMFRLPTTAAEATQIVGLLSYDPGTLQATVTQPAGANSDAAVQFSDGQHVKVAVLGTFFVLAHSAMRYGDQVRFRSNDQLWETYTVTVPADVDRDPILFLNAAPAGTRPDPTAALNAGTNSSRDNVNEIISALLDDIESLKTVLRDRSVYSAVCVSRAAVAANGIAEIRIGYGRRV